MTKADRGPVSADPIVDWSKQMPSPIGTFMARLQRRLDHPQPPAGSVDPVVMPEPVEPVETVGPEEPDEPPRWAETPVTAADVANLYRLLLFRDPENADVVRSMAGQRSYPVVLSFLSSEEFGGIATIVVAGTGPAQTGTIPIDADLRSWATDFFDLDEAAQAQAADALLRVQLLAVVLRQPGMSHLGRDAGRVDIRLLSERIAATPFLKALRGSTRPEDIVACYALFHGRVPEPTALLADRSTVPLVDTILDAIGSDEFRANIVLPTLDIRWRGLTSLSGPAVAWAVSELGVPPADASSTPRVIAAVISRPDIRPMLEKIVNWPVGEFIGALKNVAGDRPEIIVGLGERLAQIASNVTILDYSGIEMSEDGHTIRYVDEDPWVTFKLNDDALRGDLVQLRLRSALTAEQTVGHLYLDFGGGFSERDSIDLARDEDGYQHAVIAAPKKLHALRWDPANRKGAASISLIAATPLMVPDYVQADPKLAGNILHQLARAATAYPTAPVAMTLTKLLSPATSAERVSYADWIQRNEPDSATALASWRVRHQKLTGHPRISVLVPTYNTPEPLLREMIASVLDQVYENWELCIADDASPSEHVRDILSEFASKDSRIKVTFRKENGHISEASNSAMSLVTGDWVVLLDHDDILRPNALLAVAEAIEKNADAEIIYSDEDKIDEAGNRFSPFFKPNYAPELFLAQNYFNHLTAHRSSNIRAIGGWRTGLEGSQDYDLTLRILENVNHAGVIHLPEILYHWRAVEGSTALSRGEKDYAAAAGLRALNEHLERRGLAAKAEMVDDSPFYRVRHELPDQKPLVSLIIPTRDKVDVLRVAVQSILERSTYDNYELLIVDNNSIEDETFSYFRTLEADRRVRVINYPGEFNYSAINNHAATKARGSIIGLVNNDVEVISADWIEEMTSWALQDEIGCVGAKLFYQDMTVQHAGVILGLGGVANHGHKHASESDPGYFGRLMVHHTVSAVTAACLFIRKSTFDKLNGLDERLAVAFNDVDFCIRVRNAGYRNMVTPFARLYHHESLSRGVEDTPAKMARFQSEVNFMMEQWKDALQLDPFYSPHLTKTREDYSLGV